MKHRLSIALAAVSMMVLGSSIASAAAPVLDPGKCNVRSDCEADLKIGAGTPVTSHSAGVMDASVSASDASGNRTMVWSSFLGQLEVPTLGPEQARFHTRSW